MFALFSGATLQAIDSVFTASQFQPYNGDALAGNDAAFAFIGENFRLATNSAGQPPVVATQINLSAVGDANRYFFCYACGGIGASNLNVTVTGATNNQITYVDVQRLAGTLGSAPDAGLGDYFINALVNGDSAGLDAFRYDFPGKIREFGGPLMVNQLAAPAFAFQLNCATPGSTTWFYKATAASGSGESLASIETSVTGCANTVNATNFINGRLRPVLGADSYKIYRSTAAGGSGSEGFALQIPANQSGFAGGNANTFQDTTPDGSLGGPPPNVNTTGNATVGGVLAAGAGAATGAVAGDLSASRSAGSGTLWLGSDGTQSLDFGVTNPGAFSLLGGGLFTPAMSISGAGQLLMGSTTVASLPACNGVEQIWLAGGHGSECSLRIRRGAGRRGRERVSGILRRQRLEDSLS